MKSIRKFISEILAVEKKAITDSKRVFYLYFQ